MHDQRRCCRNAADVAARACSPPKRAQDCPGTSGGCFSSSQALRGALAEVRVWRTERSRQQIRDGLGWPWLAQSAPPADATPDVLVARWTFDAADRSPGCAAPGEECIVRAVAPSAANIHLTVSSPSACAGTAHVICAAFAAIVCAETASVLRYPAAQALCARSQMRRTSRCRQTWRRSPSPASARATCRR
jgi:hypothetical protein